jgi:hypothetical protein
MEFSEYINKLSGGKRISAVKLKILITLWESSPEFPKSWVTSDHLLEITGQKYFDRRARELRDEYGADIETTNDRSTHLWRLNSPTITEGNKRSYLTQRQKDELFVQHNYTCQVCGKRTGAGTRGLQADHKVPLIRGGKETIENWQSLCNECNVSKRRACQGCDLECQRCVWAYPEEVGMILPLPVPPDLLDKLTYMSIHARERLWDGLRKLLENQ